MDNTELRLSKLERQVRSYRRIALSAVALLTVGLTGAVLHHQEKVLQCDVLKTKRIELGAGEDSLVMTASAFFQASQMCKKIELDTDATVESIAAGREMPDEAKNMMKKMIEGAYIELKPDMTYVSGAKMMGQEQTVRGTWRPENPLDALSGKGVKLLLHQTHADDKEQARDSTGMFEAGVLTISMKQMGQTQKMVFGKKKK